MVRGRSIGIVIEVYFFLYSYFNIGYSDFGGCEIIERKYSRNFCFGEKELFGMLLECWW